jgi:hypothetical protein
MTLEKLRKDNSGYGCLFIILLISIVIISFNLLEESPVLATIISFCSFILLSHFFNKAKRYYKKCCSLLNLCEDLFGHWDGARKEFNAAASIAEISHYKREAKRIEEKLVEIRIILDVISSENKANEYESRLYNIHINWLKETIQQLDNEQRFFNDRINFNKKQKYKKYNHTNKKGNRSRKF